MLEEVQNGAFPISDLVRPPFRDAKGTTVICGVSHPTTMSAPGTFAGYRKCFRPSSSWLPGQAIAAIRSRVLSFGKPRTHDTKFSRPKQPYTLISRKLESDGAHPTRKQANAYSWTGRGRIAQQS